uniref:Uncharacterized protein n=1 Tax=Anguilla anguilla TaxID=7936 RepID=A0A0E9XMD2_ANGAN
MHMKRNVRMNLLGLLTQSPHQVWVYQQDLSLTHTNTHARTHTRTHTHTHIYFDYLFPLA